MFQPYRFYCWCFTIAWDGRSFATGVNPEHYTRWPASDQLLHSILYRLLHCLLYPGSENAVSVNNLCQRVTTGYSYFPSLPFLIFFSQATFPNLSSSCPKHWDFHAIIYKLSFRIVVLEDLFLSLSPPSFSTLTEEAPHTCHCSTPPLTIICQGLRPNVPQQEQVVPSRTKSHHPFKTCLLLHLRTPWATIIRNPV